MTTPYWRTCEPAASVPLSESDPNWNYLFHKVLVDVRYKDGYGLLLSKDRKDPAGRWYFQVQAERPDIRTGNMGIGAGGKAYLSVHANFSELTRTAFGLFMAYEEHECREFFRLGGRSVFGPHINVSALWEAAGDLDYRD